MRHLHGDLRALQAKRRRPAFHVAATKQLGHLWPIGARLRMNGRHNTSRSALEQIPDVRAADTKAHHQEFIDAQVIHQAELIIGIGIPRAIHFKRA